MIIGDTVALFTTSTVGLMHDDAMGENSWPLYREWSEMGGSDGGEMVGCR